MASDSDKMDTGQEILRDNSSELVAVYRFVIVDGKAYMDEGPEQGIWVSKTPTENDDTYTAHLAREDWKPNLKCEYSDTSDPGALTAMKLFYFNDDDTTNAIGDKEGRNLESEPSEEESRVVDRQHEELGKTPCWGMILDTSMEAQGGTKDDNGNGLLRVDLWYYPLGVDGDHREGMGLWWAKKEVSGRPITVLSEAELERFKLEGKIAPTETPTI